MKKILSVSTSILLAIIVLLLVLPIVFKGKINTMVLQKANDSVSASITYSAYKLSLLKSFPDFTATFSDVSVVGVDEFERDTLIAFHSLSAQIDIISILKNEGIIIKEIELNGATVQLIINEAGSKNWAIETQKENRNKEDLKTEPVAKESKPIKLLLQNIALSDFNFTYWSKKGNYAFSIKETNATISGELEGMNTLLNIELETPSINLNYDSIDYIKNGSFKVETILLADLNDYDFKFKAGDTKINNLPLRIDGGFSMPGDSMDFNIQFAVPEIDMNKLLTIIPDVYQKYMTDIETSGNVNLNGTVNGIYYDSIYPEIDMNLTVFDGTLRYPGLPDELTIHELKTEIVKPEGGLNLLQFGVSNLSMQLAENPFSMHANFSSLFTDPYIDVAIDGIVDMGSLSKVIPLGDTRMQGLMEANIAVLGNYSALKNNDFSSFLSKGNVTLSDFSINNSAVPQGVKIQNASLILQNQNIEIQRLEGGIGRSDFELKGTLNNTITYLFANDILKGDFTLNSKFLDANEFMSSSTNGDTSDDVYLNVDSIKVDEKALELPDNMHLQFNATIDKILFDQMNITNFKGEIDLVNQALLLQNLSMNMIDGQLKMNGSALADGREFPYVNLDLVVRGFDLPSAHRDLSIVQKYMPFAAKSQGEFSTKLKVKSKLSKELKLVAQDVSATGSFSTKDVKLVDAVYFSNLKSVIQYEKLKNLEVDDFTARFSIKEGNLKLEPFSTKLANQPIQLKGLYNLAGTLDFRVDATLDKDILSRDIQNMIAYIPGHQNVKKVDVGLDITGQAKKPDVKVDYDKIKKQVLEQVKNSSKEDLEDAAKKLLYDLFR